MQIPRMGHRSQLSAKMIRCVKIASMYHLENKLSLCSMEIWSGQSTDSQEWLSWWATVAEICTKTYVPGAKWDAQSNPGHLCGGSRHCTPYHAAALEVVAHHLYFWRTFYKTKHLQVSNFLIIWALSILEWTESSFRLHWLFWVDLYQLSWEFSAHIEYHLQTSNVNAIVSKLNPVLRHCVLQTWHNCVLLIFHYSWADWLACKIHLLYRWGCSQAASMWRQLWSIRAYYVAFRPTGSETLLL